GLPIAARPVPVWERLWKWGRRKPAMVALLAVSVAALLLLLVGGAWHNVSLRRALTSADELRIQAQTERDATLAQERLVREYVYGADMKLAQALWQHLDVRQALELLAKYERGAEADDPREFTWRYLWRLGHAGRETLTGHASDVHHVAYSPDGAILASASKDG